MGWKIEFIQDAGIISTTVSGVVTIDEIKKIADEVFKEAARRDVTRLISDYRNVSLNVSTADIHDLPETLKKLGRTSKIKSAIIYSVNSSNKSDYYFFDTRCFNSMLNSKIFTDYDAAYQWLMDDTTK
jgi:hypothetical protein